MGEFSWLDCQTKEQIINNKVRDVFVLVPHEYGGGHIKETRYNGYGDFGGYDIYELVADWNKKYINPEMSFTDTTIPNESQFAGLYDFQKETMRKDGISEDEIKRQDEEKRHTYYLQEVARVEHRKQMVRDFVKLSDKKMIAKYGEEYKREIGILIACYDEDNAKIKYPIKITHDSETVYEDCNYSLGDPNQGWKSYDWD